MVSAGPWPGLHGPMISLPPGPWDVIYMDPPWDYAGRVQHSGALTSGSAVTHYPTMTPAELKAMGPELRRVAAPASLIYMWVTGPQLDLGIDLLREWGWKYKTIAFIWDKMRPNPGYYTMSQGEVVIVGVRGKRPAPMATHSVRQWVSDPDLEAIEAQLIREKRTVR